MINFIKKLFGAAQSTAEAVIKPEVAKTETAAKPAVKSRKKSPAKKKA